MMLLFQSIYLTAEIQEYVLVIKCFALNCLLNFSIFRIIEVVFAMLAMGNISNLMASFQ